MKPANKSNNGRRAKDAPERCLFCRGTGLATSEIEPVEVTAQHRRVWQDVLAEIQARSRELQESSTGYWDVWYRGHTRGSQRLLPSLFRKYRDPNAKDAWNHIWGHEQDLYWEFSSRARELHGVIDEDWDILFAMQHYGVPTRLLDWTETLAVGVYFALHGFAPSPGVPNAVDPKDRACVWLLNPYELNTWTVGNGKRRDLFDPKNLGWSEKHREYWGYSDLLLDGGMDWRYPIALYPRQRTNRMQVQRGWFTIHGDKFVPLEILRNQKRFLRRVDIPPEAEPAAREYLRLAGIELFTLFPDLPNLAAHLSKGYSEARDAFLEDASE